MFIHLNHPAIFFAPAVDGWNGNVVFFPIQDTAGCVDNWKKDLYIFAVPDGRIFHDERPVHVL